MTRFTRWRAGAVVLAAGMLVAACSSGSGGPGPVDSNILPTGIAGGSGSAHGSKSASNSAKASGSHTTSRGASSGAAGSSTAAHHGGGGGQSSSTPAGHPSTSSKPGDNGCRSSAPPLATDPSKASITVCRAVGLSDGETVTITGHSFKANERLLAVECRYLGENADNYGLSDCDISNLLSFKPGVTTKSDAHGNVGPISITLAKKFKHIDCVSDQCLISVAVPLQSSAADNPHVLVYFG